MERPALVPKSHSGKASVDRRPVALPGYSAINSQRLMYGPRLGRGHRTGSTPLELDSPASWSYRVWRATREAVPRRPVSGTLYQYEPSQRHTEAQRFETAPKPDRYHRADRSAGYP